MNGPERLAALAKASERKDQSAPPLAVVQQLDEYFQSWGILPVASLSDWNLRLRRSVSAMDCDKFERLKTKRSDAFQAHGTIPAELEIQFYNFMCKDPLLGLVHSKQRPIILDTACFLLWAITALQAQGEILDLGCHAGYHALALARHVPNPIRGVDGSARAIEYASNKARGNERVRFHHVEYAQFSAAQNFDLIYCSDGWPRSSVAAMEALLRQMSRLLAEGGVLVCIGLQWFDGANFQRLKQVAAEESLGFGYADFVGGFQAKEFPAQRDVLVFIKGVERPLCEALELEVMSNWDSFQAYASALHQNDPQRLSTEMTQAYHRARWMKYGNGFGFA